MDKNTGANSGQDIGANTTSGPDQNTGVGDSKDTGIFSQEQQAKVNQIVSKRVNDVRSEYSEKENKAQILDSMLQDPKFQSWLESQSGEGEKDSQMRESPNLFEGVEDMDDMAKALPEAIKSIVQPMLQPLTEELKRSRQASQNAGMQVEMQHMSNTLNDQGQSKFPYMVDPAFQQDVYKLMQTGRASQLQDAYLLAANDRQVKGQGVPDTAYLLQGHFGGQNNQSNNTGVDYSDAPKNSSPEELLEYVSNKLGYK